MTPEQIGICPEQGHEVHDPEWPEMQLNFIPKIKLNYFFSLTLTNLTTYNLSKIFVNSFLLLLYMNANVVTQATVRIPVFMCDPELPCAIILPVHIARD